MHKIVFESKTENMFEMYSNIIDRTYNSQNMSIINFDNCDQVIKQ